MKISIHGKPFAPDTSPFIKTLLEKLRNSAENIRLHEPFYNFLKKENIISSTFETYRESTALNDEDFLLSIGGDGTLLDTITYIGDKEIPVLGVNTGRLGFLATTPRESVEEMVDCLKNKNYTLDERAMLSLNSSDNIFNSTNFALNEFTILKRDTSSMIVVHTYINDEFLNSYWADGLIISTPTGSTGYSLSCGGPLVLPHSHNFIITPVSPHNLNVRPMVVADNSEITCRIEGRSNNFLASLDSRSRAVTSEACLKINKCSFKTKLVQLPEYNYLNTLRNKLNWGLDIRN